MIILNFFSFSTCVTSNGCAVDSKQHPSEHCVATTNQINDISELALAIGESEITTRGRIETPHISGSG
jgi:hypothetical protein